ncbi:proline racemase family protein [Pseudalkalibacillus decolorationis]|uniref:proline racemase family protein n=1 Tax=Pseudalkalibacillus decolorationis TaxID=163879 RepID=UPI002147318D|nr:proline racemase family protein [Pseudalkalibacillus decolorationis]
MLTKNVVTTIDAHVAGEPIRLLNDSGVARRKETMEEYQKAFNEQQQKQILKRIMEEPRGHLDMRTCIVTPPVSLKGDAGVLFKDTTGYVPLLEHGLIGVATILYETGNFQKEQIHFDCLDGQYVLKVCFDEANEEVNQFELEQQVRILHKHLQIETLKIDVIGTRQRISALCNVEDIDLDITIADLNALKEKAHQLFLDVSQRDNIEEQISHLLFYNKDENGHYKYLTIDRNNHIDRSPYTGAWAFAAFLYENTHAETVQLTNFLDHSITAKIRELTTENNHSVFNVSVEGKGYITGFHRFVVDRDDPLKDGFLLK